MIKLLKSHLNRLIGLNYDRLFVRPFKTRSAATQMQICFGTTSSHLRSRKTQSWSSGHRSEARSRIRKLKKRWLASINSREIRMSDSNWSSNSIKGKSLRLRRKLPLQVSHSFRSKLENTVNLPGLWIRRGKMRNRLVLGGV